MPLSNHSACVIHTKRFFIFIIIMHAVAAATVFCAAFGYMANFLYSSVGKFSKSIAIFRKL